ncbi:MAG: thiamine phosphate synthase [Thermoleophilia bacterium]|nr:thiamine phosphate synthase [Thermoleophilia bacterium]
MRLHALVSDLETARRALAGGATVLQLRLKDAPTDEAVARGRPFAELAREAGADFVVNDDVEAARRLGADYVHLGRADLARLGGRVDYPCGLSAASADEAVACERAGAAYLGAGPVWATPTKTDADPAIGLDGLAEICRAVSIPVVAIGGVDASNAAECVRAGASGVAVVRAAADAAAVSVAVDAALAAR